MELVGEIVEDLIELLGGGCEVFVGGGEELDAGEEGEGTGGGGDRLIGEFAGGDCAECEQAENEAEPRDQEGEAIVTLGEDEVFAGLVKDFGDDFSIEVSHVTSQ